MEIASSDLDFTVKTSLYVLLTAVQCVMIVYIKIVGVDPCQYILCKSDLNFGFWVAQNQLKINTNAVIWWLCAMTV
jgi:hypothetical protein